MLSFVLFTTTEAETAALSPLVPAIASLLKKPDNPSVGRIMDSRESSHGSKSAVHSSFASILNLTLRWRYLWSAPKLPAFPGISVIAFMLTLPFSALVSSSELSRTMSLVFSLSFTTTAIPAPTIADWVSSCILDRASAELNERSKICEKRSMPFTALRPDLLIVMLFVLFRNENTKEPAAWKSAGSRTWSPAAF